MPNAKKTLLDKLYKVYKDVNGPGASSTDRINFLYKEGGYKDKVDKLLADKSDIVKNASAAKGVIEEFHRDIFPRELEMYFDENPHLDRFKDFSRSFDELEKTHVGTVGPDRRDYKWNLTGQFGRKAWVENPNIPFRDVFIKELDNDYTKSVDDYIKKIESQNRDLEHYIKTPYRSDKYGNAIGDGTWHANYSVWDIPGTDVTVSPSSTTESVYVTYRTPDGKSSRSRFSNHFSNAESKSPLDNLIELGYLRSEPIVKDALVGRNVKKKAIDSYQSSGKTYDELLSLPDEERRKYKDMLIVDSDGNKKNWLFNGNAIKDTIGKNYFVRDEFIPLFMENFKKKDY